MTSTSSPPTVTATDARADGTGTLGAAVARLEVALLRPADVAWLSAYRFLLGASLAVSMQRFLAYGWVDELLVSPRFRFHYWGFGWVEPLSSPAMHALFWALFALGVAVAIGLAFRVTAPLFALGLTYVQLLDVSTYLNHYYLAALLSWLLALSPAARAFSVDAWIARRLRGREPRQTAPVAWLTLFRVQVGVVYVFAALAKAQPDWLVHGQPLGIWLGARTDLPVLGWLFTLPGVPLAFSWAGFLFDATIVGWLLWRRSRPWAYLVVVTFHVLTRLLFDIGMFPIIMTASALVFFPPSWPRTLAARVQAALGRVPSAAASLVTPPAPRRASRIQRALLGVGALYCLLQIAVPLRAHLYGGNVLWHEQGMRFSWRVLVRAKGGATTFLVREASGRVLHVSPREYLTPFQENEMASQPDLVLQLAHRIRDDYEARTGGPVEVRAEVRASLNGRRGALMVDPDVDLARIEDGLAMARWILPAPTEAPPSTRPVR